MALPDFYILEHSGVSKTMRKLTALFGLMVMPPRWCKGRLGP